MKRTHLKMKIRNGFIAVPLIIVAVLLSCCKDDVTSKAIYDPSKPVVCEKFFPDSGGVGTKLIIVGQNFGSDTSLVKVKVNNKNARVIGVNDTRIYAVVPSRADTGLVNVTFKKDTVVTRVVDGQTIKKDSLVQTESITFPNQFLYQFKKNVSTLCGHSTPDGAGDVKDGTLDEAWFKKPVWLCIDNDINIYVVEEFNGTRCISVPEDKVTTPYRISGSIVRPRTCELSYSQDTMFLTNDQGGDASTSTAIVTRNNGFMNPKILIHSSQTNAALINPVDGEIFYNRFSDGNIFRWDSKTQKAVFQMRIDEDNMELAFAFTKDGKTCYVICRNRHYIFKCDYDFANKKLINPRVFAGSKNNAGNAEGLGLEARFNQPSQGTCDEDGNLYVADRDNHCIRKITPDGMVTTYAGVAGVAGYMDGEPLASKFRFPEGLAFDKNGVLYVADSQNHRIRKILIE